MNQGLQRYYWVKMNFETLVDKSIWARAFSECKGEDSAAKAHYISLRVERLVSKKILDEQNIINAQS